MQSNSCAINNDKIEMTSVTVYIYASVLYCPGDADVSPTFVSCDKRQTTAVWYCHLHLSRQLPRLNVHESLFLPKIITSISVRFGGYKEFNTALESDLIWGNTQGTQITIRAGSYFKIQDTWNYIIIMDHTVTCKTHEVMELVWTIW